jgi:hypothetical protein
MGRVFPKEEIKSAYKKIGCKSDGKRGLVTSGPQVGGLYKSGF